MNRSVIVPIYNDAYLVNAFILEFIKVFKFDIKFTELIFINDGSENNSWEVLKKETSSYPFIKIINLRKNYGRASAIMCGYELAKGKYVSSINIDLQDPIESILDFEQLLNLNKKDIIISRRKRYYTSFLNQYSSRFFYKIFNWMNNTNFPLDMGNLRVMTKEATTLIKNTNEKIYFLPAIEATFGLKTEFQIINQNKRIDKKTSFNFFKRIELAIDTILVSSEKPLKKIIYFGGIIALFGFVSIIYLIIRKLFFFNYLPGFTTTTSLIAIFSGIIITIVGISGLFIAKIFNQVQNRPNYLIREIISNSDIT